MRKKGTKNAKIFKIKHIFSCSPLSFLLEYRIAKVFVNKEIIDLFVYSIK